MVDAEKAHATETKSSNLSSVVLPALGGGLLLSLLSIGQKYILGADPFALNGFLIPAIFGSFSGAAIGAYYQKVNEVNSNLEQRVIELEALNRKITTLESMLPICSCCKKIRVQNGDPDRQDDWEVIEKYITSHTTSKFTHGICPECRDKFYPEED